MTMETNTRADVRLDEFALQETQARVRLDPATIQDYAEAMTEGATFPPVILFREREGELYWIGDGYHRIEAARQVGFKTITAEVRRGGPREALLWAAGANQTHGLRRTNADKRRAVLILLQDAEWRQWSDRQIARHCGVSHEFVRGLRPSLSTVDSEGGQRTYTTKHGTVATMDTSRIGAHETTIAPATGAAASTVDTARVPVVEREGDDLDTHPTPIIDPEVDDAIEDAWDEEADSEEEDFAIYLKAWEAFSRAHAAWWSHVRFDRQLAAEMVGKGAGAEVAIHIEALQETAASLQDFAAALQRACQP
jgi:uncharacterized ParB-like nuclease family protein